MVCAWCAWVRAGRVGECRLWEASTADMPPPGACRAHRRPSEAAGVRQSSKRPDRLTLKAKRTQHPGWQAERMQHSGMATVCTECTAMRAAYVGTSAGRPTAPQARAAEAAAAVRRISSDVKERRPCAATCAPAWFHEHPPAARGSSRRRRLLAREEQARSFSHSSPWRRREARAALPPAHQGCSQGPGPCSGCLRPH